MCNSHCVTTDGTPLLQTEGFKRDMIAHYNGRLDTVVSLGRKYSDEYFFTRNQIRMWENTFGGQVIVR